MSYFQKFSLASYSTYRWLLPFRSIWGLWQWSQMIPHTKKHGIWHQNQVSSMFGTLIMKLAFIPLLWPHWAFCGVRWPCQKKSWTWNDLRYDQSHIFPLDFTYLASQEKYPWHFFMSVQPCRTFFWHGHNFRTEVIFSLFLTFPVAWRHLERSYNAQPWFPRKVLGHNNKF